MIEPRGEKKHNHESCLRQCTRFCLTITGQEKERTKANLLNVNSNEDVLNSFGEEETTCVSFRRLPKLIKKEIFVKFEKQEKCEERQPINNRRDN